MQSRGRAITHGVELEQARAAEAEETLEVVLQGDSLKAKASGSYGALYLNPPYDQADGKRLELRQNVWDQLYQLDGEYRQYEQFLQTK